MKNIIKKITANEEKNKSKKKIENLVFLIIILIATIIITNNIWKEDTIKQDEEINSTSGKVLASEDYNKSSQKDLEIELQNILTTIKNVGKVKVLINYSESSSIIPLYDESNTTSTTEEEDSTGGTRNTIETQLQKEIIYTEKSGTKEPVIQKNIMPTIQGAIITAEGAGDSNVKTNIINAVSAVTGLGIDKIQVFEIEK